MKYEIYMKRETYIEFAATGFCTNPRCCGHRNYLLSGKALRDMIKDKNKCNCECCGRPLLIQLPAIVLPELFESIKQETERDDK